MTRRGGVHRSRRAEAVASRGESPVSLRRLVEGSQLRPLRPGEEVGVGVVVFSDGVEELVLRDPAENDSVRALMRSHCEECAAADLRTARGN